MWKFTGGNFKTGMLKLRFFWDTVAYAWHAPRSQQLDQAIRRRDEARAEECLEEALRRRLGAGVGWKDREGYVTDMFGKESVWKVGGMYEWCWCIEGLGIFLGFWKFFFSGAARFDGFWWGFAIAVQSPSFPWLFRILEPSPRQYCGWFANYILFSQHHVLRVEGKEW